MTRGEDVLVARDGARLFVQSWETSAPPRGVMCLVHGLGEHSGRYRHFADDLTSSGYAVVALDLRGHGRSPGRRGHTPFPATLDDLAVLIAAAQHRRPGVPCFLYGHSLGGLIVLTYLVQRQPHVAGAVAASPGLRSPLLEQRAKILSSRVLGSLLPTVTLPTGLDSAAICRDPQVVADYRKDPLVHDRASMALARDGVVAAQRTSASSPQVSVPLLLLHGTADTLTYPQGTEDFAARATGDCTLRLYEGLWHELHNEPERGEVLADVVAWLDARTSGSDHSPSVADKR